MAHSKLSLIKGSLQKYFFPFPFPHFSLSPNSLAWFLGWMPNLLHCSLTQQYFISLFLFAFPALQKMSSLLLPYFPGTLLSSSKFFLPGRPPHLCQSESFLLCAPNFSVTSSEKPSLSFS